MQDTRLSACLSCPWFYFQKTPFHCRLSIPVPLSVYESLLNFLEKKSRNEKILKAEILNKNEAFLEEA